MNKTYANMTKAELIKALQTRERKARPPVPKPAAVPYNRLVHDLRVHQEELEAQNLALRESQQLLEESRSRYAELYDLAPLGYVTLDDKGIIREINLTGAAMLGIERSRLIGLLLDRFVVKEDRAIFREHLRDCRAEAEPRAAELRLNRHDGSTLYVELHSVPTRNAARKTQGCLTAITDIAERKRIEQTAHESEVLFQAIFESAGIGMALADTSGRIRQSNSALQKMLGYTAEELGSMLFTAVTHPDDVPMDHDLYAELVAGERDEYQIEKRYRRKDGEILWGRLTCSLVRDGRGGPRLAIQLVENITERRWAEAEITRLNQGLERRAAELAIANQELDSFSYSVSHDLRAPLASIGQLTRAMLQDGETQNPTEVQRYVGLIHENTLAMSRLIEDLLHFARMSRQPLNKLTVQPAELVRQVLTDLQSAQPARAVEIVIGDLPPCEADPALLAQVWVNLLSNALKFTGKCDKPRIEIGCEACDGADRVYYVRDNGVGFDMKQADRLFGVFQRLHAEEDYPGTGVGLAIVERIVRRHGGRVWAEGKPGEGASFFFTLARGDD